MASQLGRQVLVVIWMGPAAQGSLQDFALLRSSLGLRPALDRLTHSDSRGLKLGSSRVGLRASRLGTTFSALGTVPVGRLNRRGRISSLGTNDRLLGLHEISWPRSLAPSLVSKSKLALARYFLHHGYLLSDHQPRSRQLEAVVARTRCSARPACCSWIPPILIGVLFGCPRGINETGVTSSARWDAGLLKTEGKGELTVHDPGQVEEDPHDGAR